MMVGKNVIKMFLRLEQSCNIYEYLIMIIICGFLKLLIAQIQKLITDFCSANAFFLMFGFPDGSEDKASACNAGDLDLMPGLGRSPGERNGNPLQYSCLEKPMDKRACQAPVHRAAKSQTRLSDFTFPSKAFTKSPVQFNSVQLLSRVRLLETP